MLRQTLFRDLRWWLTFLLLAPGLLAHQVQAQRHRSPSKASRARKVVAPPPAPPIQRTILLHVDALFPDAAERLNLPHLNALRMQGTWVKEATVLFPYHPTVGDYGALHTTSLPNPITMTGTVFLTPRQPMLQTPFFQREQLTAHIANSTAYESLNQDFHYVVMDRTNRDADNIATALDLLQRKDVRFLRLLLQDLNNLGSQASGIRDTTAAWYGNVWHEQSPYRSYAWRADSLVGHFVQQLKQMGKWENTLLVLVSDGTSNWGWHPPISEETWRMPLLFVGPGIAIGREIPYADQTDIMPTILALNGLPFPNANGGHGGVLLGLKAGEPIPKPPARKRLMELNRQLKRYWLLTAELRLLSATHPAADIALMASQNRFMSPHQFYGLERLDQWLQAGSLDNLLAENAKALAYLEARLIQARTSRQASTTGH